MAKEAPACRKALNDATLKWPNRNRASDGIMASSAHHTQNPKSDHETGNAFDLTHDIEHGVNCNLLATALAGSNDPRIKYIIWNAFIWFPTAGRHPQGWSAYHGANPHRHHLHVSIRPESRDDLSPWPWTPQTQPQSPVEPHTAPPSPTLKLHDQGEAVKELQTKLAFFGLMRRDEVDGRFGFHTQAALRLFQQDEEITADAICGAMTWKALDEALRDK